MSLDIYITATVPTRVFDCNITHNLAPMARAAGLYDAMWTPKESGFARAGDLRAALAAGIRAMHTDPQRFQAMNPANGWGDYNGLLGAACDLLRACEKYPEAEITTSR